MPNNNETFYEYALRKEAERRESNRVALALTLLILGVSAIAKLLS